MRLNFYLRRFWICCIWGKCRCSWELNGLSELPRRIRHGLLWPCALLNIHVHLFSVNWKIRLVQQAGHEIHVRLCLHSDRHIELRHVSLSIQMGDSQLDTCYWFRLRSFIHSSISNLIKILPVKDISKKGKTISVRRILIHFSRRPVQRGAMG